MHRLIRLSLGITSSALLMATACGDNVRRPEPADPDAGIADPDAPAPPNPGADAAVPLVERDQAGGRLPAIELFVVGRICGALPDPERAGNCRLVGLAM